MYMKKIFNFALIAATVCGLSFAVTSCKDDDNNSENNNGGTEQAEGTMNEAQRFWNVAGHLVSPFDMTDDYKDKTFEPTIGEPLEGSSTIRVVAADNMDVVASLYNDMTDAGISASTASHTFEDGAVGTLTYTKSTDGKSLATIDVNIKQIPHLLQIVFKTREQLGINASTTGQPYYSFGDVISRPNADNKTEYWMCVHMTFTPQNNGDSYWITLNALPQANIETYVGSNGFTYKLPKGLKTSEESMQNLAEMLYAAMEPEEWEENAKSANCPLPFGDVKRENVKYINRYFWERVVKGWNTTGVDEKVFGTKWGNLAIKMQSQNGGLHLLRKGYSWWFLTSNNCSLFEYTYKSGEYDKKANAHNVSNREVKQEVIKSKITVNCENDYTNEGWVNEAFFGDSQPRFIFRFATGNQLFGTTPNIYTTMAGKNGIKDEYVYTKMYDIPVGSHLDMEELKSTRSAAFYHTGDVYKDENGHHWMVTYMSGHKYDNSPYTELVSLDALTFSSDKAYATNAPTKTEMLRGYAMLWFLAHAAYQGTYSHKIIADEEANTMGVVLQNLKKANLDPRSLLQKTLREDNARNDTEHCSVAYREDGDTKQRLMRMIMTSDLGKSDVHFNFWEHYPATPSATAKYCEDFSHVPIYLQDVANQSMVDTYGKDYYAKRPISSYNAYVGSTRNYRTTADSKASQASNYLYQYTPWFDEQYPTGMWNEPILMACFDAVEDYGVEHKTKTVKGHTLTPVQLVTIGDDADINITTVESLYHFWDTIMFVFENAFDIDGQASQVPTYQEVWEK